MTSRSHAARVWAVLLCLVVVSGVVAAPASAAPPTQAKHAKHAHKGAHGKRAHANRAKHPHRPAHPGAAKGGAHGKKRQTGHHGQRNLPVSIAPQPKLTTPKLPAGDPAKTAALWATPLKTPKTAHRSHSRVAPSWVIAIPAAALAVLALGGLIHLARRGRRPTPAAS